MRKIALLAIVAFAAACGDSSSSSPTGYFRVANLSPDVAGIDFCVTPPGGTISAPVMANAGSSAGLVYDVGSGVSAGLKQMSKYFGYGPGTYTVTMMSKAAGGSCANPLATVSVTLADGGYKTVVFVGSNGSVGPTAAPFAAVAFTDEVTVASTSLAIRFTNGTLTPTGVSTPAFVMGIPWNVGITAGGVYTALFTNIAYPGIAEIVVGGKVDANGYVVLPTSQLPAGGLTLNICPTPLDPTSGQCGSATIPAGQVSGGIVATAYMIGGVGITTGSYAQSALFCGDVLNGSAIQAAGNYSTCTSALQ